MANNSPLQFFASFSVFRGPLVLTQNKTLLGEDADTPIRPHADTFSGQACPKNLSDCLFSWSIASIIVSALPPQSTPQSPPKQGISDKNSMRYLSKISFVATLGLAFAVLGPAQTARKNLTI